jgi:menaquinol-cytochrome c reductase iron-sulfur subunit
MIDTKKDGVKTPDEKFGTSKPGSASDLRTPITTGRRTFLGWFFGIGTVTVGGLLSIPLIRFALDPLTRSAAETSWNDLGPESDFTETSIPQKRSISITQLDGWRKVVMEKPVYVVKKADGTLTVLSSVCTHLGCSVKWNDTGHQFKCPCHNGAFTPEGVLVSGPPPRDMDALESRITDGHLQVRYQSFRQLVKTKEVLT